MQTPQIQFSLKSMVDDFGRVFFANGRVYRAIHNDKKDYCLSLLNSELFNELNAKRLIPITTIATLEIHGCDLILEHEKLLETLQHEWTYSMLKDATTAIFQINTICNKYGYELKDAHTLNVLFRGTQPVMVDIGSIAPKQNINTWIAYEEYLGSFVIPLIFWSKNKQFITRKLLESNFHRMFTIPSQSFNESGLLDLITTKARYKFCFRSKTLFTTTNESELLSLISRKTKSIIKKLTNRNTQTFLYVGNYDSLSDLFPIGNIEKIIKGLASPSRESMWQGYHHKFYNKEGNINYSTRFRKILELIKGTDNIHSIIDLAGNEGYFTQLLDEELDVERLILADYDENAIDSAYCNLKQSNTQKIHAILLNFMFTPDLKGTTKRLQCDLVIALAVTHHLILTGSFSLPAIFERLHLYTNKYVMVEFMPLGLWATGDTTYSSLPEWYTREWFRNEFDNYFNIIVEEQLEQNRILFFGEIKE